MNTVNWRVVGTCGLYCGGCNILRAYRTGDNESRAAVARRISKAIHKKIRPEDIHCDGCSGDESILWQFFRSCKIRSCARKRDLHICTECSDFPCDALNKFHSQGYETAKRNLQRVKKIGVENWIREQEQYWGNREGFD